MDQVFDEINSLMDDRLISGRKKDSMGIGFQGGQDEKDFTVNEAKPDQIPGSPDDESALRFSEDEMNLLSSDQRLAELSTAPGETVRERA